MNIIDVQQGTAEWYQVRSLKMTASKAQAIGNCGAGLKTLILELCTEYLSSKEQERFSNEHTERGKTLEDEARTVYEFETGNTVTQVGFCLYSDYVGCSPDGLVSNEGLVEIKCLDDKGYMAYFLDRKIKSEHVWQMQMQMLVCDRQWCDYVVYNPNFRRRFIRQRVAYDPSFAEKLKQGFAEGERLLKDALNRYESEAVE